MGWEVLAIAEVEEDGSDWAVRMLSRPASKREEREQTVSSTSSQRNGFARW